MPNYERESISASSFNSVPNYERESISASSFNSSPSYIDSTIKPARYIEQEIADDVSRISLQVSLNLNLGEDDSKVELLPTTRLGYKLTKEFNLGRKP